MECCPQRATLSSQPMSLMFSVVTPGGIWSYTKLIWYKSEFVHACSTTAKMQTYYSSEIAVIRTDSAFVTASLHFLKKGNVSPFFFLLAAITPSCYPPPPLNLIYGSKDSSLQEFPVSCRKSLRGVHIRSLFTTADHFLSSRGLNVLPDYF